MTETASELPSDEEFNALVGRVNDALGQHDASDIVEERAARIAAEAKLATVEAERDKAREVLRQALRYVEADEVAHGRLFGTGNAIREVLALTTPAGERNEGET